MSGAGPDAPGSRSAWAIRMCSCAWSTEVNPSARSPYSRTISATSDAIRGAAPALTRNPGQPPSVASASRSPGCASRKSSVKRMTQPCS
ncbi:hypothetical protein OG422_25900 [Streptomyces sp. NBC_01525]|uniref:hypothetical protein n=1 Tax=Streptomyces sp. NBC_01525 TaxID=2903893 RepID=UPI00386660A4